MTFRGDPIDDRREFTDASAGPEAGDAVNRSYLALVNAMKREFLRFGAELGSPPPAG